MHLSDLLASYAPGDDFPQELPSGKIRDLAPIGKDLVVLTDSNLFVYNSQGKQTGGYLHGYANAICRTNGDRVITFDRGGKRFRVDSRTQELFSATLDYPIVSADISRKGYVAVAAGDNRYQSRVTVYDQEFDEIFIRSSSDLVVDLKLDNRGEGMAISSVGAREGQLISAVTLFRFTQKDPTAQIELPDELVLSMAYAKDGNVQVITDRRAALFSAEGAELASVSFNEAYVNRFVNLTQGGMFVLLDELGDGNNLHLMSLDETLTARGDTPVGNKVQSMDYANGWLYLAAREGVTAYDENLGNSRALDLPELYQVQPAGNFVYGITSDSIVKQKQEAVPRGPALRPQSGSGE